MQGYAGDWITMSVTLENRRWYNFKKTTSPIPPERYVEGLMQISYEMYHESETVNPIRSRDRRIFEVLRKSNNRRNGAISCTISSEVEPVAYTIRNIYIVETFAPPILATFAYVICPNRCITHERLSGSDTVGKKIGNKILTLFIQKSVSEPCCNEMTIATPTVRASDHVAGKNYVG